MELLEDVTLLTLEVTQRTDPRAGGQEIMFLVTRPEPALPLDSLQIPRRNKFSLSSKPVRSEFSVIPKTKNPNSTPPTRL